jgi:iron complex transport system substrate-binding protein
MKNLITSLFLGLFVAVFALSGCKKTTTEKPEITQVAPNAIKYAKGLQLYYYEGFTIVKVTQPWPGAKESFTYVMQQKGAVVPDSLKQYTVINVPLKSIVVTSTTHIPSLEMLGVENTLVGFPDTKYISSEKTRALIDAGKVKEAGQNESLNTEVIIDLNPDAVVAFGVNSTNKTLESLQQAGLKVLYNSDWTEQSPLGKAEWIKFFGALYGMDDMANRLFTRTETTYEYQKALSKNTVTRPTIMAGAMLNDQWLLPQGGSWAALFMKDAVGNYLWADTEGTGSLSLSFETVFEKAQNADIWIGPSQYTSLAEMEKANPHYKEFKAFKNKQVYSFSTKTGKTGGLIYYELANNHPDLVLRDLIAILHPELMPGYELQFFERLK